MKSSITKSSMIILVGLFLVACTVAPERGDMEWVATHPDKPFDQGGLDAAMESCEYHDAMSDYAAVTDEEAHRKFQDSKQCMREHGFHLQPK